MRLCGVKGMVHDMMHTANIHRIINFHETLEEAAESFGSAKKES